MYEKDNQTDSYKDGTGVIQYSDSFKFVVRLLERFNVHTVSSWRICMDI